MDGSWTIAGGGISAKEGLFMVVLAGHGLVRVRGINTGNSSKSMAWFTRPKTSNNLQNRITSVVRCRDDGSVAVAERSSTDVAGQVEKVATHQGDCEARNDSNAARSAQPLWLGKIAGTVVVVPLAGGGSIKGGWQPAVRTRRNNINRYVVGGNYVDRLCRRRRYGVEAWHTGGGGAGQLEWRQGSGGIVASDHSAVWGSSLFPSLTPFLLSMSLYVYSELRIADHFFVKA
ncbi:hypothetical protein NL676_034996 [Syzygium grande]|nr:hypothetical protein NL676_034996 [Syzygium grande]